MKNKHRHLEAPAFDELHEVERPPDPDEVASADAVEARVKAEKKQQFQKLRQESRAIFGLVNGNPGLHSPEKWAELLEEAGDQVGNGHFLVQMLGAERYLDPRTVAVLLTLRQNLIADLPKSGAADIMLIDLAVVEYYNFFRVQGWIGNLALEVEANLFGRDMYNDAVGDLVSTQVSQLSEVFLPLQERASRMMVRSISELGLRGSRRPSSRNA